MTLRTTELRVPDTELRVPDTELRVPGTELRVPGTELRVPGHPEERSMTAERAPEARHGLEWVVMELGRTARWHGLEGRF